jgi:hypothetical protein
MVSFTPACDAHDICYMTCGNEKEKCDEEFRDDMYVACFEKWGRIEVQTDPRILPLPRPDELFLRKCFALADAYHQAVAKAGGGAYDAAQKQGCKCLCDQGAK